MKYILNSSQEYFLKVHNVWPSWWNISTLTSDKSYSIDGILQSCFSLETVAFYRVLGLVFALIWHLSIGRVWNTSVLALGQVVSYEELNLEWNFSYVKCKIKSFPLPVASNYEKDCLVENLTLRIFVEMFDITWSNYGRTKTGLRETQSYRIEWQLINGINLDYWVQFMLDYFIKHLD